MTYSMLTTPRLDQGTPETLRSEILAYFRNTWEVYERLFDVMAQDEAYTMRADPLRHPLIFYLGHTACFFINKLILAKAIPGRVNPRFESIFAVGVDEMSWDDLNEQNYDWPPVAEVWDYRNQVRAVVEQAIAELPLRVPVTWAEPMWTILMGIEHERIHLETSSVLMRQLPLDVLRPDENWPVCDQSGPAPENEMLNVSGGTVRLGKGKDDALYGWDNEYGRLEAEVAGFRAAKFMVTNDEFQQFIDAGGYATEHWWTEEGWAWRNFRNAEHPVFWVPAQDGGFRLRCLAQEIPLPGNWPVEVNYLEAKAFCNWKSEATGRPVRLPTEEEWYRLLDVTGVSAKAEGPSPGGNLNLELWASPCPVTDHQTAGFGDVMGNVWQWTESPISGFPGFEVHPLYDDFSTPTFGTRHNLIKGGSWISTGNEITRYSRYAFRRHFFQHAGFRAIESSAPIVLNDDIYESDALIAQYCEFHYGQEYFGVPNFPARVAELCRRAVADCRQGQPVKSALDLGCATGRATFELARFCQHVTGIDFSARFIRIGRQMQERGAIRYSLPDEGELVSYHEKTLDEFGLADTRDKVEFWQGDAHNLKPQFTGYDLILAANLIDRLYDPVLFLAGIAERLNTAGVLVLVSPYTWLEEFTPRRKWLGGRKVNGENVTTLDGLHQVLDPGFRQIGAPGNIEFLIRETLRKHQHSVSQMTVWQKY